MVILIYLYFFLITIIQLFTQMCFMSFQFKELLEHMWNDWALEKTDVENKIMHQYAQTTRLVMIYHSRKKYTRRFSYKKKMHAFLTVRFKLYFYV